MSALLSLQRRCIAAFLDGANDALVNDIVGNGLPAATRISVYQNNAREGFRKALANAYPVVERLVGDACFRGLAHTYQQRHRSTSGDLQHYGADFVQHLSATYTNTDYSYLADIAELEWAIEMAMIGPESTPLDVSALAAIDPERLNDIRFEIPSSLQLVESSYPIVAIWQANQNDSDERVDLDAGGQFVVVRRSGTEVELRLLDESSFALATCFRAGQTISEALDTLADVSELDLESSMKTLLVNGCLSAVAIADTSAGN